MSPSTPALPATADLQVQPLRIAAAQTRDRLGRLAAKVRAGLPAQPAELTVLVNRWTPRPTAAMFVFMACAAVSRKYQALAMTDISAEVDRLQRNHRRR